MDWSKLRELEFQEHLSEKNRLLARLQVEFQCRLCPDLEKHYGLINEERELRAKLDELRMIISDQNLVLLPEYEQRIQVLKTLKYIDDNCTVQLKGRVACEVIAIYSAGTESNKMIFMHGD